MSLAEFKKLRVLIREALKELEQEALKEGLDLASDQYELLRQKVRERVLETQGFSLEDYQTAADTYKKRLPTITKDELTELTQKISSKAAQEQMDNFQPVIPAPKVVNKIVKEITREKIIEQPKIIETITQKEVHDDQVTADLREELIGLRVANAKIQREMAEARKRNADLLPKDFGEKWELLTSGKLADALHTHDIRQRRGYGGVDEQTVRLLISQYAQGTGNYITALTGDGTATGPGSVALTLATVNSNVGSFGSSTAIPTITVNGKGLVTAVTTNAVIAPAGTLTGTTLASNVVTSSLTAVGTIVTGVWNGTTIAVANGGTGATSASGARTALGLAIGSDVQAYDATLAALAALSIAANSLTIGTGADAFSQTTFAANTFPARASSGDLVAKSITDFGLSLVDDTDASAARTTLALGTAATQNTGTSGTNVPLLDGTNTWSATQIFEVDSGFAARAKTTDSGTTNQATPFVIEHRTSGTPAAGFGAVWRFQLDSSTNTLRIAHDDIVEWATATDATRKAKATRRVYDTTARTTIIEEASGTAAMIGFLGAAAVVRQNITGVRTGTLAQLQAVVANLLTGLANLGLITDSTT